MCKDIANTVPPDSSNIGGSCVEPELATTMPTDAAVGGYESASPADLWIASSMCCGKGMELGRKCMHNLHIPCLLVPGNACFCHDLGNAVAVAPIVHFPCAL